MKAHLAAAVIFGALQLPATELLMAESGRTPDEQIYLQRVESATFRGFEALVDPASAMPVDIALAKDRVTVHYENEYRSKTSPTNIGLGMLYFILARERGFMEEKEAYVRAVWMMEMLEKMERWKGFHYNWYHLNGADGEVPKVTLNRFVSSLDNANLDICLLAASAAFQGSDLEARIHRFLDARDYSIFRGRNPNGADPDAINLGFDAAKNEWSSSDYTILNVESRMLILYAILRGQAPRETWARQARLVKTYRMQDGEEIAVVAPWGGSLYEALFADEILGGEREAPEAFGRNARNLIRIHRDYGRRISESGIWGFSNGEVPGTGTYEMTGVPEIAYNRFPGKFVTAYSAFLALQYDAAAVIENLRAIEKLNPEAFSPQYGFTDSIDPVKGTVNRNILSLDKGMEVLAIGNYQNSLEGKPRIPDYLWRALEQKDWADTARQILKSEESHPSFRALRERVASKHAPASVLQTLNLIELRQDIGAFYEPGRAKAAVTLIEDSGSAPGMKLSYDVSERYSYSGMYMKFDDLEVKAGSRFQLEARGDAALGYPGTVKVELKYRGQYVLLEHLPVTADWKTADFALQAADARVDEMAVVFENAAAAGHPTGAVEFRSLKLHSAAASQEGGVR